MSGEIIAIVLGLLVGGSLGALGGGGSTLAVPILVFVAGMQAQDATTASLLVVGIASAFGVVGHFRNSNVRLGAGIAFGLAGVFGSRVGMLINRQNRRTGAARCVRGADPVCRCPDVSKRQCEVCQVGGD